MLVPNVRHARSTSSRVAIAIVAPVLHPGPRGRPPLRPPRLVHRQHLRLPAPGDVPAGLVRPAPAAAPRLRSRSACRSRRPRAAPRSASAPTARPRRARDAGLPGLPPHDPGVLRRGSEPRPPRLALLGDPAVPRGSRSSGEFALFRLGLGAVRARRRRIAAVLSASATSPRRAPGPPGVRPGGPSPRRSRSTTPSRRRCAPLAVDRRPRRRARTPPDLQRPAARSPRPSPRAGRGRNPSSSSPLSDGHDRGASAPAPARSPPPVTRSAATTPGDRARDLVAHLHRFEDQQHLAPSRPSPLRGRAPRRPSRASAGRSPIPSPRRRRRRSGAVGADRARTGGRGAGGRAQLAPTAAHANRSPLTATGSSARGRSGAHPSTTNFSPAISSSDSRGGVGDDLDREAPPVPTADRPASRSTSTVRGLTVHVELSSHRPPPGRLERGSALVGPRADRRRPGRRRRGRRGGAGAGRRSAADDRRGRRRSRTSGVSPARRGRRYAL